MTANSSENNAVVGISDDRVPALIFTLIANGFIVETVHTGPGYTEVWAEREDEFGVPTSYVFLMPIAEVVAATIAAVTRTANERGANVVLIADDHLDGVPGVDWPSFQARLGGPVKSLLPFEPNFGRNLIALGHNQEVEGLEGRPDRLFEEHVRVALQFLLGSKIVRYGQDRQGEARPDGIALHPGMVVVYDAKAYEKGYPVDTSSIRQFCSYVQWFNEKYAPYVGAVHSFLVVSGSFDNSEESLLQKAKEMYASCGVNLVYLSASELGDIVKMLADQVTMRSAVDWKLVFSGPFVKASDVAKSIRATVKDRVVKARTR